MMFAKHYVQKIGHAVMGLGLLSLPITLVRDAQAQGFAGGLGVNAPVRQTPVDRVKQALQQIGASVCADAVVRAANYIFEDGEGNFTIQPLGPDSNRWPIVLTMESHHKGGSAASRLTILTLAPAGTCSGSYEQIITWTQSCASVKSSFFSGFKNEHLLYQNVKLSELNAGIQLYLIPNGAGCVSIKKELLA